MCCDQSGGERVSFFEVPSSGLSTTRIDFLDGLRKRGFEIVERSVETTTLNDICDRYAKEKAIHFLKVDVEGAELNTLEGINLKKYRPWIILVENTDYSLWEPYILQHEYTFTLFDGLNRFYVANEKAPEFEQLLCIPANVCDGYRRNILNEPETMARDFYRYILGREPESQKVVKGLAKEIEYAGFEYARRKVIKSDEFQRKYEEIIGK